MSRGLSMYSSSFLTWTTVLCSFVVLCKEANRDVSLLAKTIMEKKGKAYLDRCVADMRKR